MLRIWSQESSMIEIAILVAVTISLPIIIKLICKPKLVDLQNKVVLITGASSGLGEALAHKFYKAGAKLILSSRNKDELQRVKNDMLQYKMAAENEPVVHPLDLENLDTLPERASEALKIYNKIDILINNGGMSYRGEIINTKIDVHQKLMVVNYFGHVVLTQALLPSMLERKSGIIVGISSLQGRFCIPYRSAYAASKHAFQAFFDCLRSEIFDSNITVCVVNPGYIKTNLSLNAMTNKGLKYGVMDATAETGMESHVVAQLILDGITRKSNEIIPATFIHRSPIVLRSVLPNFFFNLMNKRARKQKPKIY